MSFLSCLEKILLYSCLHHFSSKSFLYCSVFSMASNSIKLGFVLFAFLLLSSPVLCDDEEENLLQDINDYRKSLNLPTLEEADKASCLAKEIADDLEDQPCQNMDEYYPVPGGNPKLHLEKLVRKCRIDINTTTDGVIMPVCVPKLDRNDVFYSYTNSSHYAKYVNSSEYIKAGVSSEDDWMVLILATNTSIGSFSAATSLLAHACKGHYLLAFMLALLFVLIN